MGLLPRRNRRSALADRRLMAQLLRGQLDRLACAKYGMCETPSLSKKFLKLGVANGILDVLVAEIGLQSPATEATVSSSHRLIASPEAASYRVTSTRAHKIAIKRQAMSALGQKQTNGPGPKSDFVRYCPKADKRGRDWIVR
jgi:hypothetical protein